MVMQKSHTTWDYTSMKINTNEAHWGNVTSPDLTKVQDEEVAHTVLTIDLSGLLQGEVEMQAEQPPTP